MNLLLALNLFSTTRCPQPGERLLLDDEIEVIVIKAFPRSLKKCLVELPERRFKLVKLGRLTEKK